MQCFLCNLLSIRVCGCKNANKMNHIMKRLGDFQSKSKDVGMFYFMYMLTSTYHYCIFAINVIEVI